LGKKLTVSALVYWLALVCVCGFGAQGVLSFERSIHRHQAATKVLHEQSAPLHTAVFNGIPAQSGAGVASRPLYPYSIIPGGVLSREELKNAIAHDSLVAQHYADFNASAARVEKLDKDQMFYVSYRMGDRVFWTSKKLRIPKGETVITDGDHQARTRCGNRLSSFMVRPTSPIEPTPEALDGGPTPELYAGLLPTAISPAGSQLFPPPTGGVPSTPPGGGVTPPPPTPPGPGFPIIPGGGPPITPNTPPITPPPVGTPEPDVNALLGIGFAAIFGFSLLAKFRRKRNAHSA
jgi:hypothetical protein